MPAATHDFDLGALRLSSGEGRRLELAVAIEPLMLGGERYGAEPIDPDSSRGCPSSSTSRA